MDTRESEEGDSSISQLGVSNMRSSVPWKRRAIFFQSTHVTNAVASVQKDAEVLDRELQTLKTELSRITAELPKLARQRRRALIANKERHCRPHNVQQLEAQFSSLSAARNRLARRIYLHKKRKGQTSFQNQNQSVFPDVEVFSVGEPCYICPFCRAKLWWLESVATSRKLQTPIFSLCCKQGKVRLPPRRDPPEFLKELLEGQTPIARHFREFIRGYNGVFTFISLGGKVDTSINHGPGVYVYSIGGQIYHRIGSLVPAEGMPPKFAQLYIHDTANEVQNRLDFYKLDREVNPLRDRIVQGLQDMFDEHNVLVKTFRTARDKIHEEDIEQVQIKLIGTRSGGGREYDLPSANEIAALIVDEAGDETFGPDIVVQQHSLDMQQINFYHPSLMALQYPILFPYGEDGWHSDLMYHHPDETNGEGDRTVSQCDYYSYRLQTRVGESNSLLFGGKLFQQYVVNAYALVEAERLDWIGNNQSKLRAHYFQGLMDAFMRGDTELKLSGKHIILSASHTGSPRYKYENFQDAMAICRFIGYPDLFITFTCNANWPEIQFMLDLLQEEGRKDPNRADVFARVFKMKLNQLIVEIRDKKIFGSTCGYVAAIEFQKRGLPHAHLLVFLDPEDKPNGISDIDSIISAEIPDPDLDPECYQAVTSFMLHGPCGPVAPKSPCMKDGKCSKKFPKKYCSQTTIDENGFAQYRRRQNDRTVIQKGVALDNRFVVPYNRYLLLRFQAHINVEFCNKTRAIKYLFKYINKPEDRAMATLTAAQNGVSHESSSSDSREAVRIDEIKAFMDCRCITPGEACWRLFKFDLYNHSPSVMRLSCHLPGENKVYTTQQSNIGNIVLSDTTTLLLGWMQKNRDCPSARKYTFVEFPQHFTWNRNLKKWRERKQKLCIGRLYYTYPSAKERYYLRMLLHIVRGCRSFEEIRTVNGVLHDTFQNACYALGLLAEDTEWNDCLKEVSLWGSGYKMRNLFVTILIHNQVSNVEGLWNNNWELLSDDLLFHQRRLLNLPDLQLSSEQLKELCLIEIEKILQRNWKSLSDFPGLPIPSQGSTSQYSNRMMAAELNYVSADLEVAWEAQYLKLNTDQKAAFDAILQSVEEDSGKCFFVDGFGGTGKTFLWKSICLKLRSENKIVLCVASSGIAALLMTGGRTAHSRFHIPIDCDSTSTCHIEQGSELAELIQHTSLIIWDEACMSHKHNIEALDRTLRDILHVKYENSEDKTFGGMTVVFAGDFRQTLPVVLKGTRNQIVGSSIKKSYLWSDISVLKLTQNMRLAQGASESGEDNGEIAQFSRWLLDIGDGPNANVFGESTIAIPPEMLIHSTHDPITDVISATYGDLSLSHTDSTYLVGRAILAPHHETVSDINSKVLAAFPGEEIAYLRADSIEIDPGNTNVMESNYSVEFLNSLKIGNFPPHELKLKVGCPVILLRNMDQSIGLCNGTRMVVTKLGTWFIEVEILTGSNIGERLFLPRLTLSERYKSLNFTLVRRQYPIALSFAMTINKSQGQTLQHVGLCLQKQVFCHGQLYVALSRVSRKGGIKIVSFDNENQQSTTMQNIVYTEILQ